MTDIDLKIKELIDLISEQEEVKRYNEIEKILYENEFVKDKIAQFKKYQQRIVIYESHENKIPPEVDQRYNELLNELLEIPIYNEYVALQQEINELIQDITNIIEIELNKNLDV